MTLARLWTVPVCGLLLAALSAVVALTAGLFLQWSAAFYLPMMLLLGLPLAAIAAVGTYCGGISLACWLMLVAWGAAALVTGPAEAVFVGLWGVAGLMLASAIRDQWWYGRAVTALAAVLLALAGLHLLVHLDEFGRVARGFLSWCAVAVQQNAAIEADAEAKQKLNVLADSMRVIQAAWPSIGVGFLVVSTGLGVAVLASLTTIGMRIIAGRPAFRGSFREMRPPEHLVWLGILFAVLGFVDWRWDVPALRHLSWNGGIALSVVYFLNGLSVLIFVLGMLGPPVLTPLALILVFLAFGQAYPFLGFLGLFDTWGDFRARLGRWVIRMRERSEEDVDT